MTNSVVAEESRRKYTFQSVISKSFLRSWIQAIPRSREVTVVKMVPSNVI